MIRTRRLLVAGFIAALFIAVVPGARAGEPAVDLQSVRNRIESLSGEIDAVNANRGSLAREIQSTKQRMDDVLDSITSLRLEQVALAGELARKQLALRDVRTDLSAQYQSLAMTRSDISVAKGDAIRYAVESYMGAGLGVPTVALSAREWVDIGVALVYMDRVAEDGLETMERFESLLLDEEEEKVQISARETSLERDLTDLEVAEEELAAVRAELDEKGDALQDEYTRQRALLASFDTQIGEIEGELASLEKEESSIKRLITQRVRSAGPAPGTLIRPVPGAISSGFGPRLHPIYGYTRMHNGVDMNGSMGQPIVAAADGTVFFAAVKGGYGNSIMIDHGGNVVTLYAHQSKFAVSEGQKVRSGQVIGYVGSSGVSTGPHLHFEVRVDGNPVNPANYF
jgi:murein DD-endopeptidase MepM/ murein hydrolase activator NlpD